tara:strand:+ start:2269 stop:2430 length:162 start_codon:yes stop_codon:yes gene_type:complete
MEKWAGPIPHPKGDTLMSATVHLWIEESRDRSDSAVEREVKAAARKALNRRTG